jgi:hypothetical protein
MKRSCADVYRTCHTRMRTHAGTDNNTISLICALVVWAISAWSAPKVGRVNEHGARPRHCQFCSTPLHTQSKNAPKTPLTVSNAHNLSCFPNPHYSSFRCCIHLPNHFHLVHCISQPDSQASEQRVDGNCIAGLSTAHCIVLDHIEA